MMAGFEVSPFYVFKRAESDLHRELRVQSVPGASETRDARRRADEPYRDGVAEVSSTTTREAAGGFGIRRADRDGPVEVRPASGPEGSAGRPAIGARLRRL